MMRSIAFDFQYPVVTIFLLDSKRLVVFCSANSAVTSRPKDNSCISDGFVHPNSPIPSNYLFMRFEHSQDVMPSGSLGGFLERRLKSLSSSRIGSSITGRFLTVAFMVFYPSAMIFCDAYFALSSSGASVNKSQVHSSISSLSLRSAVIRHWVIGSMSLH
jgi:hypothetical protein